jgi:uncharacterized membrane protein YhaH (DUF805 family)
MNMLEAVTVVLTKYADFNGRARRSEYWYFYLAYLLLIFTVSAISEFQASQVGQPGALSFLAGLVVFGTFLPMLAVQVRRLHDIDKSGWNILWFIIPLVGLILTIVWYCRPGTVGDNRFGPDPLAPVAPEAG